MSMVLFIVLCLGVVLFFEAIIPPALRDMKYTQALEPLSLIISFIYLAAWREAFEGYSQGPAMYRTMCFRVTTLSDRFFSFHIKKKDELEYTKVMLESLIGLVIFSYRIFAAADPKTEKRYKNRENPANKYMDYYFASHNMQHLIDKHDGMASIDMLRDIMRLCTHCIKHAEEQQNISNGDTQVVNREMDLIYNTIEQIDRAVNVYDPPILHTHNVATMLIYFIVWQPFVMWLSLGVWPTVIIYPIVMFLLVGVIIYRMWLSDAFDPGRPMKMHNYGAWIRDSVDRITSNYESEKEAFMSISKDEMEHHKRKYKVEVVSHNDEDTKHQNSSLPIITFASLNSRPIHSAVSEFIHNTR